MGHILIVGMPTLQLDSHIKVLGKPSYRFSWIFLDTLALWWVMGKNPFLSRFVVVIVGSTLYVHNIPIFSKLLELKITLSQLSLAHFFFLGT